MKNFAGKICFVTGGASGAGLGQAKLFAKNGMKVAIADVRQDALDKAAKEIVAYAGCAESDVLALKVDLTNRAEYTAAADKELKRITDLGMGNLPVCMAKTQYSLSDDAAKLGRPSGFTINVREVYVSAGAGFVVAINGSIMTMPGLSKKPAAYGIDVDDNGVITGLF